MGAKILSIFYQGYQTCVCKLKKCRGGGCLQKVSSHEPFAFSKWKLWHGNFGGKSIWLQNFFRNFPSSSIFSRFMPPCMQRSSLTQYYRMDHYVSSLYPKDRQFAMQRKIATLFNFSQYIFSQRNSFKQWIGNLHNTLMQ